MTQTEVWMLILTAVMALVAIGALVVSIVAMNRQQAVQISPTEFNVKLVENLVTKQELKDHIDFNNDTHKDLFAKISGVERGRDAKLSQEIAVVHTRVNAIEKAVGGLETATNLQNNQLARIDAKLDRLAERS